MKTKIQITVIAAVLAGVITFAGCHKTPVDPGTKPTVTTGNSSKITKTSAVLSGTVTNNGGHEVTEKGFYFSPNSSPANNSPQIISGKGTGMFTCNLYSLEVNTTYYYMAFAINSLGTSYGQVKSFTTVNRDAALSIKGDSALTMYNVGIHIDITPYGSIITEAGVCFSTNHNPTTSNSKVISTATSGASTVFLTELTANTHYYARAYVITSAKTLYSPEYEIWTYAVMDVDGNGYHAVTIGNQTWTVENYKVAHYQNGDPIPNVKDNKYWSGHSESGLTTGARCYYNNDSTKYDSVYGALYNGYAINDARGFTPKGWRLPTSNEIFALATYLGDITISISGGKLKEVGTKHWKSPNTGATNSSGFTALPAGDRGDTWKGSIGTFDDLTTDAAWWEKDQQSPTDRWIFFVSYNNIRITYAAAMNKSYGFSVRLIKGE